MSPHRIWRHIRRRHLIRAATRHQEFADYHETKAAELMSQAWKLGRTSHL